MKKRILVVVLMAFVFTNNLQSQKLSRKKIQITGLKNANYLKTDPKGNVIAGTETLGASTNALIKGDNTYSDIDLLIKSNKKASFDFRTIYNRANNFINFTTPKINLNTAEINLKSYPYKIGVLKTIDNLQDNQFITKKHLTDNISNSPEIVGGDNITIDKSDPNRWVINYSAVPIDNEAPVITIDRAYMNLPRGTTEVTANISFSDANGDVLTKTWIQTASNIDSSVVIDNENNTFSNLRDDKYYSFKCVVTDVWDASSEIRFDFRIKGDMKHNYAQDIQNEIRYEIYDGEPNEEISIKLINTFDSPFGVLGENAEFVEPGQEYSTNITINSDGYAGLILKVYEYVEGGTVIGEISIFSRSSGLALPQDNPLELSFW